jgi:hypothetical protein
MLYLFYVVLLQGSPLYAVRPITAGYFFLFQAFITRPGVFKKSAGIIRGRQEAREISR